MPAPGISGAQLTDTFAGGTSRTSNTMNYGSSVANVVIICSVAMTSPTNTAPSITSMTDSTGLTWIKAGGTSKTGATRGVTGSPRAHAHETWYAISTSAISSHTITANFANTIDTGIMLITRLTGCNLTDPIDRNVALPATSTFDSASAATLALSGINTNTANVLIYGVASSIGAGNNNSGVTLTGGTGNFGGGTFTASGGTNFVIMNQVGKQYTSIQTGVSAASTGSVNEGQMFAIAFTADAQSVNGNASGAVITVTSSIIPGAANGAVTAPGSTMTVNASVIAGVASVPVNGNASGVILPVSVVFRPGEFNYIAPGSTMTVTTSLVEGGGASTTPIDGGKIFEFVAGENASDVYQTADYDSIWGRGDRTANGLMTFGQFGATTVFSGFSTAFDNNFHVGLGNGPVITGNAFHAWMEFAGINIDLRGFKFIGTDDLSEEGQFSLFGGSTPGVIAPQSYASNFDAFGRSQGPNHDPDSGTSLFSFEYELTPRFFITYPHYEFVATVGLVYNNLLCNEIWLKIAHSNLDGGDRRLTNGDPSRQVTITWSSDWSTDPDSAGSFSIPSKVLVDGIAQHPGAPTKQLTRFGASSAVTTAQTTVGAWIQFAFPRPVTMRHLMIRLSTSTTQESYSGATPAHYGKWHWEASDGPSGPWVPVGEAGWSFHEGCTYMPAPRNGSFDIDAFGEDGHGVTHWRMVLDAGPAFGNFALEQVLFDLDDVTGKAPPLTVAFTDDIDGVPATVTVGGPGSPYVVSMSDGSDDGFQLLTVTNIPNAILTVAFDDGGEFDTWSDLYPSIVVQSFVVSTGR